MALDPNAPVCPDWVWLNNSNVHVAKDRGWFKTYTPFASTITHSMFTSPGQLPALGIGTVEIPTKRSPNRSGASSHGSLLLKEVLHVPDFICNVIGGLLAPDGYTVDFSGGTASRGSVKDGQGKNVAYFDRNRPLCTIRLSARPGGPKLGPHALQNDVMYMISCRWEPVQQQRWLEYQSQHGLNSPGSGATDTNPAYTDAEKAFLKDKWRDEYHFLLQHGLSIYKDEDRAEGRTLLRAFMREDDSDESENEEDEFAGHQADYNFSEKQLDWIEAHYGNSERFMMSYGLKFYDDEDVDEAKAIVDVMMLEDE